MIQSKGKWVVAVGSGKEGEVVVIDSITLEFKQIKLFAENFVEIKFLEITGKRLLMNLWIGGVREAEIDE